MIYDEIVNAWIGDGGERLATFKESEDNNECYMYSMMLPGGSWVVPQLLHKTHVKKIERLVRH
tara:strand:- start:79 stop:267 length:189 start_codon:yes stop_codon:yes gene_type:complete